MKGIQRLAFEKEKKKDFTCDKYFLLEVCKGNPSRGSKASGKLPSTSERDIDSGNRRRRLLSHRQVVRGQEGIWILTVALVAHLPTLKRNEQEAVLFGKLVARQLEVDTGTNNSCQRRSSQTVATRDAYKPNAVGRGLGERQEADAVAASHAQRCGDIEHVAGASLRKRVVEGLVDARTHTATRNQLEPDAILRGRQASPFQSEHKGLAQRRNRPVFVASDFCAWGREERRSAYMSKKKLRQKTQKTNLEAQLFQKWFELWGFRFRLHSLGNKG